MKRLSAMFLTLGLTVVPLSIVSAATMQLPSDDDGSLSVSVPVKDDLYLAGDKVTIAQPIEGDLAVAGGDVTVTGAVTGDIAAAGGNVNILGSVGDDVRAAGGTVRITGAIAGDVIVAGGTIIVDATTTIGGDLVIYGGEVTMLGKVGRNLKVGSENVTMLGTVGGVLTVDADTLRIGTAVQGPSVIHTGTLSLEKSAAFSAPVTYWTDKGEIDFGGAMRNGATATFDIEADTAGNHNKDMEKVGMAAFFGAMSVYSLLTGMLIIGLLLLATRTLFTVAATRLKAEPGWSLLYGLMYLILFPAVAILLMITLIGLPIGLFMIAMYIFSFVFITPIASIVFAKLLQLNYKTNWGTPALFGVSIAIFIALKLIGWIPFVGWIIKFVLLLAVFGALGMTKYEKYQEVR